MKELRFNGDHQIDENGLSNQDEASADIIIKKITISNECYVNKGFTDSNSLKEESSNKVHFKLDNYTLITCYFFKL